METLLRWDDVLFRVLRIPLGLTLIALLLTGCGGDTGAPDTAGETPQGATPEDSAFPVTVTDRLGREVEISHRPERIVALSPTGAEFVYALGGEVVGRASSVAYPDEALAAQEIGTAYQPNLEMILSLRPDLVVADQMLQGQPALRESIEGLPAPVVFVGVESYDDVLAGYRLMGEVLDVRDEAARLIVEVEGTRQAARAALADRDITALVLIGDRDRTLYAAKESSYIGDVLEQLGIANPASSQPDSGPFPGYTTLAAEKLIEYDPDCIFTITPAPPPAPRLSEQIQAIPPFRALSAVTGNHVVEAPVATFLQAPGPRVVDVFAAIVTALETVAPAPPAGGS